MIRSRVCVALVVAGLSVVAAPATPAQAAGWVANSCAVRQALHATMAGETELGNGHYVEFVPCGEGIGGVRYVTAGHRPFYVDPTGPRPPVCHQPRQRYYPDANGAKITPTVRCSVTRPGPKP